MSMLGDWLIARHARRDARLGVHLGGKRVVARLAPRPEFDPAKFADHGLLADNLQNERRIEELQEIAAPLNGSGSSGVIPAPLLLAGLIVFGVADVAASIRLMVLLGAPPHDRLVLGIALACMLVALTYGVRESVAGKLTGYPALAVITTYVLFLLSAAAVRLTDLAPAEVFGLWSIVSSLLLVLTAAGPAAMCEICFRALVEAAPDRAFRRRASLRLRMTERGFNRAQRDVAGVGQRQRSWDAEHSRQMALYNSFHAEAAAMAAGNGKSHLNGARGAGEPSNEAQA